MYVSSWPGLTLWKLSHRAGRELPYPLNARKRNSFCLARSGIYHLFRSLRLGPEEVVLVPDYYSGNEVGAMSAAGASMVHYPIARDLRPDLDALVRLAKSVHPRVIYVIHYLGWPQPMKEVEALCQEHGSILIEDCALSMLSETGGRALGTFGDYSVFCLYKTLPVPNGGLLVQNNMRLPELDGLKMEPCPPLGSIGRSAELILESLRSRSNAIGKALLGIKQSGGRMLRAARFRHVPIGDIGWDIGNVNLAMSTISDAVMGGLDYEHIRKRRRDNFLRMREKLHGQVSMLRDDMDEGVCPLFFPILVRDKHAAAQSLRQQGIGAVEFWNDKQDNPSVGLNARFLRSHVLELPMNKATTGIP